MNIFYLHRNALIAAMMMCDIHINKMILESAQILSIVYIMLTNNIHHIEQKKVYKAPQRYFKHPCVLWTLESSSNFQWLLTHAYGLLKEYKFRFQPDKRHASHNIIDFIIDEFENFQHLFKKHDFTKPALAMHESCKVSDNPVNSYRFFYRHDKESFAKYNRGRSFPLWWHRIRYDPEIAKNLSNSRQKRLKKK